MHNEYMLRLDKIISEYTPYSRREAAQLLKQGLVAVNGHICREAAAKFDLGAVSLQIKGQPFPLRPENTLMLHKPAGYVSATEDSREKTVLELIPPEERYPLPFPAGRLDKDATGLLLLTSNGDLCHRIISPKKEIYKTYLLSVQGALQAEDKEILAAGLTLESGERFLPGELEILESGELSRASLKICEGKYHQVKRMMAALGKPVLSLKRTAIGGLLLDEALAPGAFRRLNEEDIALIFN